MKTQHLEALNAAASEALERFESADDALVKYNERARAYYLQAQQHVKEAIADGDNAQWQK